MTSTTRHIAVFGDTHGHLRLMLLLCRLWQQQEGVHLDGVLQCGDLGFFPDPDRLDRATKKFAKRDPEELGYWRYFAKPAPQESDARTELILGGDPDDLGTVRCPIVFCHGNHEDFELLADIVQDDELRAVDHFERLQYLRSGSVMDVGGIRVAAIGGAPEDPGDNKAARLGPRVSATAVQGLKKQAFDVLLTHGGPRGIGGETDQW